ncbi:MAG: hypothetical protein M1817_002223 [Caeruleum heppii]|nr:MAG: hypothetical protein M1817_002223 [Caeruleum heppii]
MPAPRLHDTTPVPMHIASLKAHKSLRRPHDSLIRSGPKAPPSPPTALPVAAPPLDAAFNVTPPPRLDGLLTALPPTPPSQPRDNTHRPDGRLPHASSIVSPAALGCGSSTPVNQQSPPTPDSTPPKMKRRQLNVSPRTDPHSSRTASFRTAREEQSSSEDLGLSRQARAAEVVDEITPRASRADQRRVSDNDDHTRHRPGQPHFQSFDGDWANKGDSDCQVREWKGNQTRNATVKEPLRKISPLKILPHESRDRATPQDITNQSRPRRESRLRERIQQRKSSFERSSTEMFAHQIAWPVVAHSASDSSLHDAEEVKRLSGMSGTSTIVEAYVVDDSPPAQQRHLRHTVKHGALREYGLAVSVTTMSRSQSLARVPQRRLRHKNPMVPTRDRNSMASASSPPSLQEGSSLKWEGNSNAATLSASTNESIQPGYFDLPKRSQNRTFSETISRHRGRRIKDPLVVPPRSSSLSAPTSRNPSRSTSLTSASLSSRRKVESTEAMQIKVVPNASATLPPSAAAATSTTTTTTIEDDRPRKQSNPSPGALRLLAAAAPATTPGSFSNQSFTSEGLEVSEATAVSIYPHHNESLLVVQQRSRPASELCPRQHAVPLTLTRAQTQPLPNGDGSPLKNPREPPKPPVLAVIPPTPAVQSPTGEVQHNSRLHRSATEKGTRSTTGGGGTVSFVRRALSTHVHSRHHDKNRQSRQPHDHHQHRQHHHRRHPEAFTSLAPFARFTTAGQDRPRVTGMSPAEINVISSAPRDSKLSPFWFPRGFWDDLELEDEDVEEEFLERGRSELLEGPRVGEKTVSAPLQSFVDARVEERTWSSKARDDGGAGQTKGGIPGLWRSVSLRARRRPVQYSWSESSSTPSHHEAAPSSHFSRSPSSSRSRSSRRRLKKGHLRRGGSIKRAISRIRDAREGRRMRERERKRQDLKGRISPPKGVILDGGMI